jgi:hypothetical protein
MTEVPDPRSSSNFTTFIDNGRWMRKIILLHTKFKPQRSQRTPRFFPETLSLAITSKNNKLFFISTPGDYNFIYILTAAIAVYAAVFPETLSLAITSKNNKLFFISTAKRL